jgi:hypothetical protein
MARLQLSPPRSILGKHQGDPVLLLDRPGDLWSELYQSFPHRRADAPCSSSRARSSPRPTGEPPSSSPSSQFNAPLMLLVLPSPVLAVGTSRTIGPPPPRRGCHHGRVPPLLRPWALRPGLAGSCCQNGLAQRHSSLFLFPFGLI